MISAYFPFTYVPEITMKRLASLFGKFCIYKTIDNSTTDFSDSRFISVRNPVSELERDIRLLLNDYYNWIHMNHADKKVDLEVLRATSENIPFYNNDSLSAIRQGIKNISSSKKTNSNKDILFRACLFLAAAHYNDRNNDQLNLELENFKAKEKMFTTILQGQESEKFPNEIPKSSTNKVNFGTLMCLERIKAWASIVLQDKNIPDFIVTDSSSVFKLLLGNDFGVKAHILTFPPEVYYESRCSDNSKLLKYIKHLVSQDVLSEDEAPFLVCKADFYKKNDKNLITACFLPGLSLESFLVKIAPHDLRFPSRQVKAKNFNTVVVYSG